MALDIGKRVAVEIAGNYIEGKVVATAQNFKNNVLVKVESPDLTFSPVWFPAESVFEIN